VASNWLSHRWSAQTLFIGPLLSALLGLSPIAALPSSLLWPLPPSPWWSSSLQVEPPCRPPSWATEEHRRLRPRLEMLRAPLLSPSSQDLVFYSGWRGSQGGRGESCCQTNRLAFAQASFLENQVSES
jgi:hypothetical protein